MGTSLVEKYKNAELLTKLIRIEDGDDFVKEVNKNLQQEISVPLVCNELVALRIQGLVKQNAKGTCTSVGQMERLKVILHLITVVASFPKDTGLLLLLQHGLLFSISEIVLAAVQCVKGQRGEEALDVFQEAMKTIRVMSDHSQKANEMVCEHYFHRITQLVTSEKFLMLRNDALNTVKYFLMGCPERIRVILETKPKVKSYVDKLGLLMKNSSDMGLQTEILKVLSLLMVKVDRRTVARTWFDFDDDLDDFLQLLENTSNLDSNILSFLHKFNCITSYSSPLPPPPPPPAPKKQKPVPHPDTPICPDRQKLKAAKITGPISEAKEKRLLKRSEEKAKEVKEVEAVCRPQMPCEETENAPPRKIAESEEDPVQDQQNEAEVRCIPESEQENFDDDVRAIPETQYVQPMSPGVPCSQESVRSSQSGSRSRVKASMSEAAVHVVISPKSVTDVDDQCESVQSDGDQQDVVAGTPDISGNKSKSRTLITPKASRSSVILINRSHNTSTCLSSPRSNDPAECEVENEEVIDKVSQQVIPDSNPAVEPTMRQASQQGPKKVSVPIERPICCSPKENAIQNSSQSVQGSQESFSEENVSSQPGRRRRGRKRKATNATPTDRQTRRSGKDSQPSQIQDSVENIPEAMDPIPVEEEKPKQRRKGHKQVEIGGGDVHTHAKDGDLHEVPKETVPETAERVQEPKKRTRGKKARNETINDIKETTETRNEIPETVSDTTKAVTDSTKKVDEGTKARTETSKTANETVKAINKTTKARNETTKAANETLKEIEESTESRKETTEVRDEMPKARNETPKARNETPKAANETVKEINKTTKARSETTKEIEQTTEAGKTTKARDEMPKTVNETTKTGNEATKGRNKTPKSRNETTKAANERTKEIEETTEAGNETTEGRDEMPKTSKETGNERTKARNEIPKAANEKTKARDETPKAGNKTPQSVGKKRGKRGRSDEKKKEDKLQGSPGRQDITEKRTELVQESRKKGRRQKPINVTGGKEVKRKGKEKVSEKAVDLEASPDMSQDFVMSPLRSSVKKRQKVYDQVAPLSSPVLGTPASVYDFQDDNAGPSVVLFESQKESSPKKKGPAECQSPLRKSNSPKRSSKNPKSKGIRSRGGKKVQQSPPRKLQKTKTMYRDSEDEETVHFDNNEDDSDGDCQAVVSKRVGKSSKHTEPVLFDDPSCRIEVRKIGQEVDMEPMSCAMEDSVVDRPADCIMADSPEKSIGDDFPDVLSPLPRREEEKAEKQNVAKKSKRTSKKDEQKMNESGISDDCISPKQKTGQPKKTSKKSKEQVVVEEISSNCSSPEQQKKSDRRTRKLVSIPEHDLVEDEHMASPEGSPMMNVVPGNDIETSPFCDNPCVEEPVTLSDSDEPVNKEVKKTEVKKREVKKTEVGLGRKKRRAVRKIKSYEEVDIGSFSQESLGAESMSLSQVDFVNARIDTPCPFKKTKQKKSVQISEIVTFSQASREEVLSQRSKSSLWSVKKRPVKGYDKTYSKPKHLPSRTNMYDFNEHSEDEFSDQEVPWTIPSPPKKKQQKPQKQKKAAGKTKDKLSKGGSKLQKLRNQSSAKTAWTMGQMNNLFEECTKSLAAEIFSEEEIETRPAKIPRMEDPPAKEPRVETQHKKKSSLKTPVKSRSQRDLDDSIELPRKSPFPTPYLVDASPDMPVFNREEFMAEMRSLIQISDESSRADPTNSPLLSQPLTLMSPLITNQSNRSNASNRSNESNQSNETSRSRDSEDSGENNRDNVQEQVAQGPVKKTPAVKRKVSYQPDTPASPSFENFPELEATPSWNTPVVEMPKSPEPTPPQLLCPEIRPVSVEVNENQEEEEENLYSFANFGRITPGLFQSRISSVDTPLPNTPFLGDKEDEEEAQEEAQAEADISNKNQAEDEEENQDLYSFGNFGRITPGLFQSRISSVDTPLPNTPFLGDKEDEAEEEAQAEADISISEEIDNFSRNITKSLKTTGKGNKKMDCLEEMAKVLQDEIKHGEQELLQMEQYIYMFVAFYDNLRKRMFKLKQFQLERIQRLEDILLKLSGSKTEVESPLDDFEVQLQKLSHLFQASFNPPPHENSRRS